MLGSTGNVYEISISTTPSCTCPDYLKGNAPCKHIIYVLCKALGLTRDDPRIWQKALLEVELEDVLNSKVRKTAMASKSVIDAVSGKTASGRDCEKASPDTSGDCAICFDSLGSEKVETCLTCKGCIHAECMKKWLARNPTCPYCRSPWSDGKESKTINEGYSNYASVAGISREREYDPDSWRRW
ncbi:hypothetical protein TrCOL_g3396 [Triparma columacea]|uniref:Uncharacterized protein n=1 Tax=Triparma columacea TaxID=722753 RepID=A0A9W7G037_9STRA|nr:hypothetical protein TrCOL_g3396 [Triparma columacea]